MSASCVCFQVAEITKIMKAYINMIVKKRCSVKSVSSFGSSWIRWLTWQDTRYGGETQQAWRRVQRNAEKTFHRQHRDTVLKAWQAPDWLLIPISYTGYFSHITWNVINCLNNQDTIDSVCFLSLHQPQTQLTMELRKKGISMIWGKK